MLDVHGHLTQAKHNEEFYGSIDATAHSDWCVTALFYATLHYVEAFLVKKKLTAIRHDERWRMILDDPTLKPLHGSYRRLQERSREARYDGRSFTTAEISGLVSKDFEPIKKVATA